MPDPDGPRTLPGVTSPFLSVADAASYLHLRPATLKQLAFGRHRPDLP